MKKVKRVAGSSVGAITATLVAVGFTSQDLKEFMDQDLRKVLVGVSNMHFLYGIFTFYSTKVTMYDWTA